jgi:hypothetical protein
MEYPCCILAQVPTRIEVKISSNQSRKCLSFEITNEHFE